MSFIYIHIYFLMILFWMINLTHIPLLFNCLMVFNAIFNNISVILWWSVLLVEETGGPGENHWPVASRWQALSHNVVHLALIEIQTHSETVTQMYSIDLGMRRFFLQRYFVQQVPCGSICYLDSMWIWSILFCGPISFIDNFVLWCP
jgi:hypothetical protein